MRVSILFAGMLAFFTFVGCAVEPGTPINFADGCKIANEKKQVEISGYLDDKGGVFCSNTGGRMECGFTLLESPQNGKSVRVDIEQGSGSNAVEKLERGYKREDIKIRDAAGNIVGLSDRVKVTGKMNVMPDESFCFIQVEKIEKQ